MRKEDKPRVMEMMRTFYASPAVSTNGSEEIFSNDIDHCVGESPYAQGYVFEDSAGILGYAMLAKSYSTEFGKDCIWIEDLYIREAFRGLGLGSRFFDFLSKEYTDCIFRLEVEADNAPAVHLYKKCGFTVLPYVEMKKDCTP
jgi:ribosomal protein S18 acetylase RimI-like enzyme